jgi:hypothetical protein
MMLLYGLTDSEQVLEVLLQEAMTMSKHDLKLNTLPQGWQGVCEHEHASPDACTPFSRQPHCILYHNNVKKAHYCSNKLCTIICKVC